MKEFTVSIDDVLNSSRAIGVHPQSKEIMYFDNIHTLHKHIVDVYEYIKLYTLEFPQNIYLCMTWVFPEVDTVFTETIQTMRYSVNPNGYILFHLARHSTGFRCPTACNITLPSQMLDDYLNYYGHL